MLDATSSLETVGGGEGEHHCDCSEDVYHGSLILDFLMDLLQRERT